MADGPWPTPLAEMLAGQGPMPFRDFMAEALYAPKHGYHTRRDLRRAGGRPSTERGYELALAEALAQAFTAFARDHRPRIVEQGPGSGRLMRYLLSRLPSDVLEETQVVFIEPLLARRTRLVLVLQEMGVEGKVVSAPHDLEPGPAFVVAKELLSSFPVHWVQATEDGWQEVTVTFEHEAWGWEEGLDVPPVHVRDWLSTHAPDLAAGQRYEANLQLGPWLGRLAAAVDPGRLIVLDRMTPSSPPAGGTVQAWLDGELVEPYVAPGRAELSAAVDRRVLEALAEENGLAVEQVAGELAEATGEHLSALSLATSGL